MQLEIKRLFCIFAVIILSFPIHSSNTINSLNSGTGLIITPTARFENAGAVKAIISKYDPVNKINLIAYPFNWLEAQVYYNDINVRRYYPGSKQSYKDKGFSFKVKIKEEDYFPAIAIGFDDIAGTSIFKSEYIVLSKRYGAFDTSFGLGFGALGTRSNVRNFIRQGERAKWDFGTGGVITNDFFKGESSFFGGLSYTFEKYNNISFLLEYDTDDYSSYLDLVPGYERYTPKSRYNFGTHIPINKNFSVTMSFIKGDEFAVSLSSQVNLNQKSPKIKKIEAYKDNTTEYKKILADLSARSIYLQNATIDHEDKKIFLNYSQSTYQDQEELTAKIKDYLREEFSREYEVILISNNGAFGLSKIRYNSYSDIPHFSEENDFLYEFNPRVIFPVVNWNLQPNLVSHIGSPSGFFFGGIEGVFNTEIALQKNLQFNSSYTFPIYDNFDEMSYNSNPTNLYPVRTNIQDYLKKGKTGFNEFTINYFVDLPKNQFLQFSIGHFEKMFSGFHAEYLFRPYKHFFSAGLELSRVFQRSNTKEFSSFQNYAVNTGHLNFYAYEQRNKILAKLSYGRYLAKDRGFTIDLSRYFKNGAQIGAFFSLTNISKQQFGEGSFDKGVYIKYPLNIFNKKSPSRSFNQFSYKPITRDGASKLNFPRNLFDLTRDSQSIELNY